VVSGTRALTPFGVEQLFSASSKNESPQHCPQGAFGPWVGQRGGEGRIPRSYGNTRTDLMNPPPVEEHETQRCVQMFWFRGVSCRRIATSWCLPGCACGMRAQHGRLLPPTNCEGWPKSTRTARHPSKRARRCPRTQRHLPTSYYSNSSRKPIPRRLLRLPRSVYGTMLSTGVSTPSDFAPERLNLTDDGAVW
jgi:hypothetical protein